MAKKPEDLSREALLAKVQFTRHLVFMLYRNVLANGPAPKKSAEALAKQLREYYKEKFPSAADFAAFTLIEREIDDFFEDLSGAL